MPAGQCAIVPREALPPTIETRLDSHTSDYTLAPARLSPGLFFPERSITINRADLLARRARKAQLCRRLARHSK